MGLLVQTAPLNDTIQESAAETYENQLQIVGAVPPITWLTTVPSPYIIVSPGGSVGTAGDVPVGTYAVSGTMTDSAGVPDSGIWAFTLTVVNVLTPQAAVTPISPLPPTGIEILVPFQIDPVSGMVATAQDYATVLEQHVETILLTAPGERVMLPTYGVGMENKVFDPITRGLPSTLQSDITTMIQALEPAVTVISVDVNADAVYGNVLDVTVTFTAVPYTGVRVISVTAGGGIPVAPTALVSSWNPNSETFPS